MQESRDTLVMLQKISVENQHMQKSTRNISTFSFEKITEKNNLKENLGLPFSLQQLE